MTHAFKKIIPYKTGIGTYIRFDNGHEHGHIRTADQAIFYLKKGCNLPSNPYFFCEEFHGHIELGGTGGIVRQNFRNSDGKIIAHRRNGRLATPLKKIP